MPLRILVVCTANICRSRIAEAYLADEAERRGADAEVESAAVVLDGLEVPVEVSQIVAAAGVNLPERPGRMVTDDDLQRADLIIGMTREHVREIVVRDPGAWPRTFTLKELVRRASEIGARPDTMTLEEWLSEVHDGRETTDLLGSSEDDDVADPYGGSPEDYDVTAREIARLVRRAADLMW